MYNIIIVSYYQMEGLPNPVVQGYFFSFKFEFYPKKGTQRQHYNGMLLNYRENSLSLSQ